ncbi:hypothetical protein HPB50_017806 [Hyalomma asiaticum]|uniref:Uncharacterized protein n=1 Tax=Hyalomma asiaticum TaxID=266040 RepID=A0ACB7SZU7_HYAAI|nr:hypothetical protein HPB50_017806 [Hyalomma asiaticum]
MLVRVRRRGPTGVRSLDAGQAAATARSLLSFIFESEPRRRPQARAVRVRGGGVAGDDRFQPLFLRVFFALLGGAVQCLFFFRLPLSSPLRPLSSSEALDAEPPPPSAVKGVAAAGQRMANGRVASGTPDACPDAHVKICIDASEPGTATPKNQDAVQFFPTPSAG